MQFRTKIDGPNVCLNTFIRDKKEIAGVMIITGESQILNRAESIKS